ncbi:MAG: hypothetical protein IPO81_13660 [Kouleothrix sp.]|nr:hypothetical protein [Kouleothrix sp.]
MHTPPDRDPRVPIHLLSMVTEEAGELLPVALPIEIAPLAQPGAAPGTVATPRAPGRPRAPVWPPLRALISFGLGAALCLALLWVAASTVEWGTGRRILPWSPYGSCGATTPDQLPAEVRVGLYEEFPTPWRLAKLQQVDFPVTLAVAAPTRAAFLKLRATILHTYPQVREVLFWPLLAKEEGYYPGTWSDADALQRAMQAADGMPVLWDLEMPPDLAYPSIGSWPRNLAQLDQWLRARTEPVHIWRSHTSMGLDPPFLRLVGMHFDPLDYPAVSLHLDLYAAGVGLPAEQMARILRCGVERYGQRFIPALGVLDDGHAPPDRFVPIETLRRDLQLTRAAGVSEVWLFGVNGLSEQVVRAVHEALPVER